MHRKILSFPQGHFNKKHQLPLTKLMISALMHACAKQKQGIRFGPSDIKGSFSSLITRGLVTRTEVIIKNIKTSPWQVTPEAISMLKALGMEVSC